MLGTVCPTHHHLAGTKHTACSAPFPHCPPAGTSTPARRATAALLPAHRVHRRPPAGLKHTACSAPFLSARRFLLSRARSARSCRCRRLRRPSSTSTPGAPRTTRAIIRHDSPNHLGLRCDALPAHQMARIASDCARAPGRSRWPRTSSRATAARLAVGETVILLHPLLPLVGVSIGIESGCQQNDSLADGQARSTPCFPAPPPARPASTNASSSAPPPPQLQRAPRGDQGHHVGGHSVFATWTVSMCCFTPPSPAPRALRCPVAHPLALPRSTGTTTGTTTLPTLHRPVESEPVERFRPCRFLTQTTRDSNSTSPP